MTFLVSFDDIYLTVDEVWPSGDAPENPTAADAVKEMDKYGGLHRVIREWNLITELRVTGADADTETLR